MDAIGSVHPMLFRHLVLLIENTEAGKVAVKRNPNRKLYAVLVPTNEEITERFLGLLDYSDEAAQLYWYEELAAWLPELQSANSILLDLYEPGLITDDLALFTMKALLTREPGKAIRE